MHPTRRIIENGESTAAEVFLAGGAIKMRVGGVVSKDQPLTPGVECEGLAGETNLRYG